MIRGVHSADMCFPCFPCLVPIPIAHFQPAAHTRLWPSAETELFSFIWWQPQSNHGWEVIMSLFISVLRFWFFNLEQREGGLKIFASL